MSGAVDRAQGDPILWRCRRGMKELDLLLERFARQHYRSASPERQRAFERLLELPDPLLVELLLGPTGSPAARAAEADPAHAPRAAAVDGELAEISALVAAPTRR